MKTKKSMIGYILGIGVLGIVTLIIISKIFARPIATTTPMDKICGEYEYKSKFGDCWKMSDTKKSEIDCRKAGGIWIDPGQFAKYICQFPPK